MSSPTAAERPLVSVVIPTHNRSNLVLRGIQSVLRQSYDRLECIVVDDASTDDTREAVESIRDPRLRYCRHAVNRNACAARNTGIRQASGQLVALLDDDDEWLPSKLDCQVTHMARHTEQGVVYCGAYRVLSGHILQYPAEMAEGDVYQRLLSGWAPLINSSVLVRKALLEREAFDEALPSFQDYDLWLRLARLTEFGCVRQRLVLLHQHSASRVSSSPGKRSVAWGMLRTKWETRLNEEERSVFLQGFVTKYLHDVGLKTMFAASSSGSVKQFAVTLARELRAGMPPRKALPALARRSLGGKIYDALALHHMRRRGLVVGRYKSEPHSWGTRRFEMVALEQALRLENG